ncbi:MAG: NUDIX domain-containing protein [Alphaproteobacteria bacterium]|nr:MAG: NUDIX domain-containing protein [Alphaproteobacteria bacterium]
MHTAPDPSLKRRLLRFAATRVQKLRKALWRVTGPPRGGVHALVFTPAGRIVLVRLTYAPGWRMPGGGRHRGEAPEPAILRELTEEIGLLTYSAIERVGPSGPDEEGEDLGVIFIVRGAEYRWRRSLEIEEVAEFDPHALPEDAAGVTRRLVPAVLAQASSSMSQ